MAMTKNMLTLHKWLGLVGGVFILIAGATAVGLNHGDQLRALTEGHDASEGPYAHSVLATAAYPDHLLVGTNHGLFESTNGGKAWHQATLPVEGDRVGALVRDGDHLWASVAGKHVLRSDDAGRHWAEVAVPLGDNHVEALGLDAAGQPVVVTEGGVIAGGVLTPRPSVPGVERAKRMQSFIAELHMGDMYGRFGVPITDIIGLSLIALVLSGYFLFIQREYKVRMARRKVRLAAAAKSRPALA
ncbi:MAG: hypothetical protein JWM80_800 [Cyanobacteria bacterium RYN_339]|nr:hypothetical protein [Cyanobacteria bacterium RYN_339]